MLYPQENETREFKDLCGIWRFRADFKNVGRSEAWFASPLRDAIPMPVPSSYNDITQDASLRDHVGEVWYERTFFVPVAWQGRRVGLRFASVEHGASVWINGLPVTVHEGGFLPFSKDVSEVVLYGAENRLTVAVSNILTWESLPPGFVKTYDDRNHPPGFRTQEYQFDFFNYSGLQRPVVLTSVSPASIDDVAVRTRHVGGVGKVEFEVSLTEAAKGARVRLLDEEGSEVAAAEGARGVLEVPGVRLWQPGAAYLYTLECTALDGTGRASDVYRVQIGVRTVKVTEKGFFINDRPFYFKGCCKHEDMDIKGRGFDAAVAVKDFNLMQWLGANSFRTSHYPYSEELLQLADRAGVVVIDEAPAVGMRSEDGSQPTYCEARISARTLHNHKRVMEELVKRDRNHPCVVMWSVANEPIVNEPAAGDYFGEVIATTRKLDPTRPVTLVTGDVVKPEECYPFRHVDVMCINRYHSWYSDPGHLEVIEMQVIDELSPWHEYFKKPLILSEYGADTIAGFHADPPVMFSEEYQCELLERFHAGFDKLPFVIGEHVWNFADFATKQGVKRVGGNKKGVFTRQRQPKAAAFTLRRRWTQPWQKKASGDDAAQVFPSAP